jgi:NADH-quinone oxidoreductase subunit E
MAVRRLAETQPESFAFTQENRAWAERQVAKFPDGRQASAVIQLLWRAQEQEGWVTKPAIEHVAEFLGMPVIRVLEVATFYTMFHLEPVGRKAHVQVCGTTPCMLRGSDDLMALCRERIHAHPHHLSTDGDFSWEEVECLGACVNAPMVQIGADTYEDLTRESFSAVLDAFARGEHPRPGPQNGRHFSMSIAGPTTLRDIAYADADVRTDGWAAEGRDQLARAAGGGAVEVAPDEPQPVAEGNVGGEMLEAEQQRRKGRTPKRETQGGVDPATGAAEAQEIARVDPTGRSDEAASRAMRSRTPEKDAAFPGAGAVRPGRGTGADKSAQPRSDRDSSSGDKEG